MGAKDSTYVTLENILSLAKSLVKRKGIKCLVIDPWNRLDHRMERGETETAYISRALDMITTFAARNDVLVHLIAHPTKMGKDASGLYNVPALYDISGSAHFYNKAFYGLSIYRKGDTTEVYVQKVKFKHLGQPQGGVVAFTYDINSGRYHEITSPYDDGFLYGNHLKLNEQLEIPELLTKQ